ncbi:MULTISPECIES: outer membrane beta-barrel protein [unclassified Cellulophaga]|uniref:outer membrane beta-barrel protein n=1 Tax=unclassified Cellulophaga TaxID=2634405 RepID=UPI0026E1CBC9|nr:MULTISPECIES: outer membrane beta-barrel protein [unclassified Cellulophaga]MDO6491348.1 TonB-dependent receptor [Cellulophaga sp. 2_MG-2023]MDO6495119.1 TonB-dependent receptor [Cellulophaga sp. 3_MG-2023]
MKTLTKTIFILLLGVISTQAQNKILGKITENNLPLEYANVILYNQSTKEVVTGTISDKQGVYAFNSIKNGTYYIEVSMLGFKTKTSKEFQLSTDKELNFTLNEEAESLNEVVVKSKRPVIRQTAEKLIVDLENSEMINSNLKDVMKRVPGVIVTNNGISYAGQNNIRILINGKTTDYMDMSTLLRDMPADNIARVEMVEQPGAEFDAAGSGPVINIILKKNVRLGTNGTVVGWVGEDEGVEYGTSASIGSYKNKLNWQASAGYSSPTWREDLFIKRTVDGATYDQATIEPYNPKTARVSGSVDYYITEEHTIGVGVRNINTNSDRNSKSSNIITSNNGTDYLLSQNSFNRDQVVFNVNPYYEYKTDKQKLAVDFNFVDYTNDNLNTISSLDGSTVPYTNQRYLQDGEYQIKTYKIDYSKQFTENFKLSFGSKYADVDTDSDLMSFSEDTNGEFVFNEDASNRFLVEENIFALYSKLNVTSGEWSFSGGLRFEDSNTKGTSNSTNETRERKISKLFPSASVSKKLGESLSANVAYSYRISRPSYSTLNSFVTYYDPLSSDVGNENLKPAFTNNYQFNLTFDGQPFFTIGYSETKDAMFQYVSQNTETAEISRTTINLTDSENWNFRLFGPLSFIKGVDGYTGFIVNYNKLESVPDNLNLDKWSLIWFTQASYELPWEINAEISGNYGTGALDGGLDVDWFAGIDFSLGKTFLDDRLKVNLGLSKILNRGYVGKINYNNLNADIESNESRRNVQLRVSYSFGSRYGKQKNRENSSKEEQNRIEDNN